MNHAPGPILTQSAVPVDAVRLNHSRGVASVSTSTVPT